jgi:hypothetical protein
MFLDDQRLSPLRGLIQVILTERSRGGGLSRPALRMLIATVASSVPIHLAVPASVHRGPCLVLHLGDVAPGPFLVQELLAGKEPVHQEMQETVRSV